MGVEVSDVLSAAAALGLGTALSASASAEVFGLSAMVREQSQLLAAEVAAVGVESRRLEACLQGSHCPEWQGRAAESFRELLGVRAQGQGILSADLEDVAAQVRLAGQLLAAQLEALAGVISVAGRAVDSTVRGVAESAENLEQATDIARDIGVLQAQQNLRSLIDSPQLGALRRELVVLGGVQ